MVTGDRRRQDRRRNDRRQQPRPPLGESWFGADSDPGIAESLFALTAFEEARSRSPSGDPGEIPLSRIHRIYFAARAAIGVSLVAAQVALGLIGARASMTVVIVCIA